MLSPGYTNTVSSAAEILVFFVATISCAATLGLTWLVWKALAPAMTSWDKAAIAICAIAPLLLAVTGADDDIAAPVILGYTVTLATFWLHRAFRRRPAH
jgi:hypothetical protein